MKKKPEKSFSRSRKSPLKRPGTKRLKKEAPAKKRKKQTTRIKLKEAEELLSRAFDEKKSLRKVLSLKQPALKLGEVHTVGVSKFDLGSPALEEGRKKVRIPQRYYDNKIVLMVRDPWWLHAYWDISPQKEREVVSGIEEEERGSLRRVLRVYEVSPKKEFFDIFINEEASNWYINVNKPESLFFVEIGFLSGKGKFYCLARSNKVTTPYFGISQLVDEEWVLPEEEYYRILGVYDLGKSSLERRKKVEEIFKRQISSWQASETFSLARERRWRRKFFLEVYTELILYGKTEPDAELTVGGKPVSLNKDGTFSLRYALPSGKFSFPVEAVSQDKKDRLRVVPVVERSEE